MKRIQFILRLAVSPIVLLGMVSFFLLAGMIFVPAGLMYLLCVAWVLCFKWVFLLFGIRLKDMEEIEDFSYMIWVMLWRATVNFVCYGTFERD